MFRPIAVAVDLVGRAWMALTPDPSIVETMARTIPATGTESHEAEAVGVSV
jgi:hypothetical protein